MLVGSTLSDGSDVGFVFARVTAVVIEVGILTTARIATVENLNIVSRRSSPLFRCIEDLSREYQ